MGRTKKTNLEQRIVVVERLTKAFLPERVVYLIANVVSIAVLIVTFTKMLINGESSATTIILMFGNTGVVTFTVSRLLRMWDQSIALVTSKNL